MILVHSWIKEFWDKVKVVVVVQFSFMCIVA